MRIIAAPNSIYWQKNYNSGGVVADEKKENARIAHVVLHDDPDHQSALDIPLEPPETSALGYGGWLVRRSLGFKGTKEEASVYIAGASLSIREFLIFEARIENDPKYSGYHPLKVGNNFEISV